MLVIFKDGWSAFTPVYQHQGAAMVGDPTAYCFRYGKLVWVVPGVSVDFVEA